MEWISVKDDLPGVNIDEYVAMQAGWTKEIITTDGNKVWVSTHGGDPYIWKAYNPTATHWMYLPEPPKQ